jgi:hypothetical protein
MGGALTLEVYRRLQYINFNLPIKQLAFRPYTISTYAVVAPIARSATAAVLK